MDSHSYIVLLGHDPGLLETRRLVLQGAGLQAFTAATLDAAEKLLVTLPASLLILCPTLSVQECEHALAMLRSRRPDTKCLVVSSTLPAFALSDNDEVLSCFDGPRALVNCVRKLLSLSDHAAERFDA